MLITLHLSVLYGSQNKEKLFLYCVNWLVFIIEVSVYCAVRIESLYNTGMIRLRRVKCLRSYYLKQEVSFACR